MNNITRVGFPGLGIEMLELNKVAFSLFGKIEVRWYGIFITFGIVLAFLYVMWRGKRNEGVCVDDVIDVGIVLVLFGIIGARLYYVLTTLDSGNYKSFYDVIAIWNGGIAIYGAVIGGALAILLVTKYKKIGTLKFCDMVVPALILAQAIGRWGNFFNGEAHGALIGETTVLDLFGLECVLPSGEGTLFHALRMHLNGTAGWGFYHPTFLYESVWNLAGFTLLTLLYRHKRFHGQIMLTYFTWYGLGRTFIEGLRTDSLYIPGTTLRISQCVGALCVLVGGTLLIALSVRYRHRAPVSPTVKKAAPVPAPDAEEGSEATEATEETAETEETPTLWARVMETLIRKKSAAAPEEKEGAEQPEEPEEIKETEEDEDGNEN